MQFNVIVKRLELHVGYSTDIDVSFMSVYKTDGSVYSVDNIVRYVTFICNFESICENYERYALLVLNHQKPSTASFIFSGNAVVLMKLKLARKLGSEGTSGNPSTCLEEAQIGKVQV